MIMSATCSGLSIRTTGRTLRAQPARTAPSTAGEFWSGCVTSPQVATPLEDYWAAKRAISTSRLGCAAGCGDSVAAISITVSSRPSTICSGIGHSPRSTISHGVRTGGRTVTVLTVDCERHLSIGLVHLQGCPARCARPQPLSCNSTTRSPTAVPRVDGGSEFHPGLSHHREQSLGVDRRPYLLRSPRYSAG